MPAKSRRETAPVVASEAKTLTQVVTQLRRALRASIRTDYPWESRPMAQIELLLALHHGGAMRVGEIAARLRLAPNTVSGLLQTLVEAELVERGPEPSDRRVAVVSISDSGGTLLRNWEAAHQKRLGWALEQLSASDQRAVRSALGALDRLVEKLDEAGENPSDAERP